MRHPAKVDWWIRCAILAGLLLPVLSRAYWAGGIVLGILVVAIFPQWYETTPRGLLIRSGLTRRLVPYQAITFIGPSSAAGSNVALSLDRVKVEWRPNSDVLIAPADPDAFFTDMASRTPHLAKRGQRLVVPLV